MEFALRYFKDIDGKPTYFAMMSGIGPSFTNEPSEAARFASEDEARASPCFSFALAPTRVCEAPKEG
jgi:hypothetical protein